MMRQDEGQLQRFTSDELQRIRSQFPILKQEINGEPLIYFDNAATTQKPQPVLDELMAYYSRSNANIHRGVHTLSQRATDQYEAVRQLVAKFIGSQTAEEIIFTSGTTGGLNLLARGLIEPLIKPGDQIMVTALEHHSNLIPWQEVCKRTGAELVYAPLAADMTVDVPALENKTYSQVKVIAVQHISNVLGIEQPLKAITQWAHKQTNDVIVIVDGAQGIQHQSVDVNDLGIDAYCFSGHKLYAPSGAGVCYLNRKWHQLMEPVWFGGEMIHQVGDYQSNYKEAPWKFEAGTPPIEAVIGLGAAIQYIDQLGLSRIQHYEQWLTRHLFKQLDNIEGVQLHHPPQQNDFHGIMCFNLEGVHPHDAATGYDMAGIAVRAGHHCAQPLMRYLNVAATLRASLSFYNTIEEVDSMVDATKRIKEFFNHGLI